MPVEKSKFWKWADRIGISDAAWTTIKKIGKWAATVFGGTVVSYWSYILKISPPIFVTTGLVAGAAIMWIWNGATWRVA